MNRPQDRAPVGPDPRVVPVEDDVWDPNVRAWIPRPSGSGALIVGILIGLIVGSCVGFTVSGAIAARPATSEALRQPALAGAAPAAPSLVPGAPLPPGDAPPPAAVLNVPEDGGPAGSEPPAVSSETGVASWYCCTRGYRGTAVVALPGARYVPVGREPWGWVNVCVFEPDEEVRDENGDPMIVAACGTFPVVDACGCPGPRIVDLSIEAVAELDLESRRGLWPAQVEIVEGGRPAATVPATEVGP